MPLYGATGAPLVHTHAESDVTSLPTDLSNHAGALWLPSDHGMLAWTCEVGPASNSTILATAGVLYGFKLKLPVSATITNILCRVATAGASLTNTFLALLDSSGNRVGLTADQSAVFNSANKYVVPLASPIVGAAAGTYYACVLCGSAGTLPTFARQSASAILNDGTAAATGFRAWSSGSGLSAVPSSVTLSGTAALNLNLWFGLS